MRKTTGTREEDGDWVDRTVKMMCSLEGGPLEAEPSEKRPFTGLRTGLA